MLQSKSNSPASAARLPAAKAAAVSTAPERETARDAPEPRTDTTSIKGAYAVVGVFFLGLLLLVLVEALRH